VAILSLSGTMYAKQKHYGNTGLPFRNDPTNPGFSVAIWVYSRIGWFAKLSP
jgi:hypothetical protein